MSFPDLISSNYRTGLNANEFYCYGGVFEPSTSRIQITMRPDSYFLCKKIHMVNYVNITSSTVGLNFMGRILNNRLSRWYQNIRVVNQVLGGNCHSPNVLSAPILFDPASVVTLDMDRTPTRVHWCMEGEKIYNPDPSWVRKMQSRFWYQYGVNLAASDATQIATLDIKDPNYDFAVFRILSAHFTNGVLSNANPGVLRIREKGPNGWNWSNEEVPQNNFSGVYGNGAGPRRIQPPIIIPGTTQLEIITRGISTGPLQDLIFDGVKFPRGTRLEEWL